MKAVEIVRDAKSTWSNYLSITSFKEFVFKFFGQVFHPKCDAVNYT